jgi:hypothetical protein
MKKLPIIGIVGLIALSVFAVPPSDVFYYSGNQQVSSVVSVRVLSPKLLNVTSATTTVPAITNTLTSVTTTRTIQNCGTNAILFCLGGAVATTNYHGVIAGGNAVRDGLGSVLDISRWPGAVSLMTESGSSTAVITTLIH